MNKLFEGARQFSRQGYENHKSLFDQLKDRQKPHTLFLTCSDSRIVPALITQSLPGELFVIRNVANIVPPAHQAERFAENLSAVEYAVQVLNVDQVVICGHSNCGGCRALFSEPVALNSLPHTSQWLKLARPARERAKARQYQLWRDNPFRSVEQENILLQMENMNSHPFVNDRQKSGSLPVFGWYYDIGRGEILNYNPDTGKFERIE
ncbi:MAG TPA: carbonic anhydrase [Bacteroidales bacterium]|nr:carbonic anhydrase [Bacteroidales bacterium]